MRFVGIKTAEQQAALLLHRGRERLVRQRTTLVNALRAHLAEFGVIAPHGLRHVARLVAIVRDDSTSVKIQGDALSGRRVYDVFVAPDTSSLVQNAPRRTVGLACW